MKIENDLRSYPQRQLELLASMVAKCPVRISLSNRIKHPVSIVTGNRTAFLNPDVATLHDLIICAETLGGHTPEDEMGIVFREDSVRRYALCARVLREFPALNGLESAVSKNPVVLPRISAEAVEMRRDSTLPSDVTFGGDGKANGMLASFSGVGFEGTRHQINTVIRAASRDYESLPKLASAPWARTITLPLKFDARFEPGRGYDWINAEADAQRREGKELARCMRRRHEGRRKEEKSELATETGEQLDAARLHDAWLAMQTGQPAPVFRKEAEYFTRNFQPEDQLYVIGIDLNSTKGGSLENPAIPPGLVLNFAYAFEILESACAVIGFADRVVELDKGRKLYLHQPVLLKAPEEGVDSHLIARLAHGIAVGGYPQKNHEATADVPRQLQTIEEFSEAFAAGTRSPIEDAQYTARTRHARKFRSLEIHYFCRSLGGQLSGNSGYWAQACRVIEDRKTLCARALECHVGGVNVLPEPLVEAGKESSPEGFIATTAFTG